MFCPVRGVRNSSPKYVSPLYFMDVYDGLEILGNITSHSRVTAIEEPTAHFGKSAIESARISTPDFADVAKATEATRANGSQHSFRFAVYQ
ncbi:hypothetical protein PAAG_11199 [Paracoccidioides lutzii Pb01]|uniref:Uncharacterized protein n=1 Tax=Paracoccidioides lutzii (strain ATCC MYA-826 / Pb01) TaxID=502779 RepID=A0A0A2V3F5_PARBA|nr:hypothetical protein PAAG_11199 [Paracoccidioides lutzii Pb01]KGQ02023.1 hypothetical protein PAAG_11199 [Paracoccidioides lutzii Pb01]